MNEEMMLDAEEMIAVWMEMLLEKHDLSDEEELTAEQIKEEIKEEMANLDNERMWDIGNNVEVHEAYLEYLEELLNEKED